MDTVDLEEMGLIDGSSTFISDVADSHPILYTEDGVININSEYLSSNGNRVTYVTIPNLLQIVQDSNSPDIGYLINNNQIRFDRPIILNEDNLIDAVENSADENSDEFLQNQISDCWTTPNDSPVAAPTFSHHERKNNKTIDKVLNIATSSKKTIKSTIYDDVEPPDKSGPLFCEQCGIKFSSWKLFRKHKLKHLHEKPFKCNLCRESFNYENNLILHQATHNVDNPFCPICKKKFSRIASLKAHILLHEQEESLFCGECGEEFSSSVYLEEHIREHKEERVSSIQPVVKKFFKCNCCSAKFQTFAEKKEHIKEFHKSARNRKLRKYSYNNKRRRRNNICDYCTKSFEKPSQLLRHKRIHTGERPFKCEICSQAFNQKGSLQIHMLKHTRERPYVCQYCKGTFSQKGNLQAHIKRLHFSSDSDERNFKCKFCSCVFRKLGSLNAHFTKAHFLNQQSEVVKQRTDSVEKFKANKASADSSSDTSNKENEDKSDKTREIFVTISNNVQEENVLEGNLNQRKVKNAKSHNCSHCHKEFKRSSDLIRHVRTHTQEKPVKCTICLKTFAWNSKLAGRLKTHSEVSGYCCPVCSKSLSTSGNLKLQKSKYLKSNDSPAKSTSKIDTVEKVEVCAPVKPTAEPAVACIDQMDMPVLSASVLLTENGSIVDISSEVEDDDKEKDEFDENFRKCVECNLTFKFFSHLRAHRQKEHGEIAYKCKICPCSFTKPASLKKHMQIHSTAGKYVCEYCGKIYSSEIALKKHSEAHTPGYPWACPVCGSGFKSFIACRKHIVIHPKIGPLKYKPMAVGFNGEKNCNKETESSKDTLQINQSEQVNNETKNQKCLQNELKEFINSLQPGQHLTFTANEDGGFSFSTVSSEEFLDGQYTIIEEKNISNYPISPSQQKQFFMDNTLENCIYLQPTLGVDETVIENGIGTLLSQSQTLEKCDVNNLVFTNETDFSTLKAIHSQEKPHTCLTCNKSFISAVEYEEHMKFHLKKEPVPTEVISVEKPIIKTISLSPTSLFRNLSDKKKARSPWRPPARRLTAEETKVLSSIDSQTASISEKVLLQSLLEKEKYEHPVKEEPKTPEKHQNKCKYCPKSFKKPSDLTRHLRTHTGERPFQCTSCHKRFSIKSTASSHMKTHTKDKSFSCFICSKNFASTGSLKIHMRLHTGLKPFSCNFCGAKFRTSGHKKAHLKKHLKEEKIDLKEGQTTSSKKSNDEGNFLENILKEAEYLSQIKTTNNEIVTDSCVEGSQYLVPLNTQNMVTSAAEEDKTSISDMSDYLININEAGNGTVSAGFIVEKLSDDQIIVRITEGNSTILSNSNHSIPSTSTNDQVCIGKYERKGTELQLQSLADEFERDYTCSECDETFSHDEDLRTHKCSKAESLDLALDHELFLFSPV